MFITNGDGTYTVRFFSPNETASYVTVNTALPVSSIGTLMYAQLGVGNSLWLPLAEKAYAEWDETGNEGRNNINAYRNIAGGWMGNVDAQVLGHAATNYGMTDTAAQQAMINAVTSGKAVTISTDTSSASDDSLPYGLYGNHAYAVIGYNSANGNFTLYNPWGCDQPGPLTWAQLGNDCQAFAVADPSGMTPISAANGSAAVGAPAVIAPPSVAATIASGATLGQSNAQPVGLLSARPETLAVAAVNASLASSDAFHWPSDLPNATTPTVKHSHQDVVLLACLDAWAEESPEAYLLV